jgi:hypothetical protein
VRLRIFLAMALLTSGFSMAQLALPDLAFACSCAQGKPIGEYANEPNTVIVAGTVTAVDANSRLGAFKVERWYKGGPSEDAEVIVRSGDGADCGIPLSVGQDLVMVAFVEEQTLSPSICSPWADLSLPEGQQLQAEAVAAYGEGTAPGGSQVPVDGDGFAGIDPLEFLLVGGAIILGIIVIVAGASFVSARRGA